MTAFERAWRILKMGQHSSHYQIDQAPHAGYNTPLHEIEQAFPDIHESPHYYDNRQPSRNWEQAGFYPATDDMFGETLRIMNESRNNPSNKVRIYRAIPDDGSIPDEDHEINEGDWVALSEAYAHEHGNDYLDGNYVVLDKLVDAQHLYSNGDSIYEFGYDTAERDIEKASFDEQAYNNFKRLMAKNPDVEEGFEEGGLRLLDNGDFVDLSDGSRYRYDEETEDEEYIGKVPVEIGRGIEHQVYSIPQTQMREGAYVAKIPLPRFDRPDRVNRNEVYDGPEGVTRSPIEAYWSKVLGRSQPVLPYSLFNSKGSLDLVQRDMRAYNPYIEPMSLQMAHLLGLEDVPSDAEDFLGEYDEVLEDTGEPPTLDTFGGLVGYGNDGGRLSSYGDPYAGNVSEEGLIFDYGSKTPFVEDTRGGMIPKEQIERILQDAIHEQKNVPKRYSGYQSDLDQTIRQLISELEESSKKGRFTGSSISFPEIRRDMDL